MGLRIVLLYILFMSVDRFLTLPGPCKVPLHDTFTLSTSGAPGTPKHLIRVACLSLVRLAHLVHHPICQALSVDVLAMLDVPLGSQAGHPLDPNR